MELGSAAMRAHRMPKDLSLRAEAPAHHESTGVAESAAQIRHALKADPRQPPFSATVIGLSCVTPPAASTRKRSNFWCGPLGVGVSCVPAGSSLVMVSV
jgi:hypothetical protein